MSSKLEKLLISYTAERDSIKAELEERAAEMDYSRVQLFSKALNHINQQLQTLYNLQDKWHDEKEQLEHWIKLLEKSSVAGDENYMQDYYACKIAIEKERLAELSNNTVQKTPPGSFLHEVLLKLLSKELESFTLVLLDSQKLLCHIRLVRKTLILTVPEVRRHRASYTLRKSRIRKLKSLGFRLYDNKDKLMLFAPYFTLEEVDAVQRVLARITFEVFYFKALAGETFIRYYP
jgi:hypothetical protein